MKHVCPWAMMHRVWKFNRCHKIFINTRCQVQLRFSMLCCNIFSFVPMKAKFYLFSFILWIIISVAISRWGNIFANRSRWYQVRNSRECNSTLTEALNINLSTRIDIIVVPKILDILGLSFNIGISLLPYIHYCLLHILVYLHLYP